MCLRRAMPFLPNRLWRRQRWAVGGGTASLISSPGGLISGCTPGRSLWSPDIISIPTSIHIGLHSSP